MREGRSHDRYRGWCGFGGGEICRGRYVHFHISETTVGLFYLEESSWADMTSYGPARAPKAANWAFGAFLLGSVIQWEYCQAQRRKERVAMARAVEIIDRKQAEKKAQAAEAARLRKEAAEKAQQAQKSWYKFW